MESKVKSVKKKWMSNLKNLYESAFPVDERRDFRELEKLVADEDSPFNVIFFEEGGDFSGFLTYWRWDDIRYFEHFAVVESLRNGGRGAVYLQNAIKMESTPVILEVEPPIDSLTKRRVAFYERNGLCLWNDIYYMQPPYGKDRNPMELKLMTYGDISLEGADDERILRIKKVVYGVDSNLK